MEYAKMLMLLSVLLAVTLNLFGCDAGEEDDTTDATSVGTGEEGDDHDDDHDHDHDDDHEDDDDGDDGDDVDDCACVYQGSQIPASTYNNYPIEDPGKYASYSAVEIYGSSCAAWDAQPGTPWFSYCPSGSDFSGKDFNWCMQPWCYVSDKCSSKIPTSVYNGSSVTFYSYETCGCEADCYTDIAWITNASWPAGCPFDPYGDNTYTVHKAGNCACLYQGENLASATYTDYPTDDPGKYKNLSNIKSYGTICAAWDQVPETPWVSYCPADSDWCHQDYNWCIEPWCYVGDSCSSKLPTQVFNGSSVTFYSYDTCLSTPDCYTGLAWENSTAGAPAGCPFDGSSVGWYTGASCSAW